MKDILGREITDGDLCIGMAIGRDSSGMHLGVFKGSSIRYLSNYLNPVTKSKTLHKSSARNIYLIENPTQRELNIKYEILKYLEAEEQERRERNQIKTIPPSKLEVGGLYEDNRGNQYIYLGKRKVTVSVKDYNYEKIEEGNCFVSICYKPEDTDQLIIDKVSYINPYTYSSNITVLKGNKKLVKKVRQLRLDFPIRKAQLTYNSSRKITKHSITSR